MRILDLASGSRLGWRSVSRYGVALDNESSVSRMRGCSPQESVEANIQMVVWKRANQNSAACRQGLRREYSP